MDVNTNSDDKFSYEKDVLKFWEEKDIYNRVKAKNVGNEKFNHVDGPPFPTGEIHVGHLRNWAIKDSVLRFRRSMGYDVYARDGYDVHGLPVENKVQAKLGLKTVDDLKEFGEENFVAECKKYVSQITSSMKDRRERYGLWMDREHYVTSNPEYLSMAWKFFKKSEEKGLLYKDYKTVAWCPHDETTLSDYEIKDEYKTLIDPSVYIRFKIKDEFKSTSYDEYLVIWTTTPWTLQSNMAIAVNPKFDYSKVLVEINDEKCVLVIGNSIIDSVMLKLKKSNKIGNIEIIETFKGSELEGIKYEHIYLDETPSQKEFANMVEHKHIHSVILADYVTLDEGDDILTKLEKKGNYKHSNSVVVKEELDLSSDDIKEIDGTGLVHIAPGHGQDDYDAAKKYNIPIFCPVDKSGILNEGKFKGKYFKDVNPIAVDYLKEKGVLIHSEDKSHRYPCCWRCKTPIVYRAADQWWIKRGEITKEIIKANSNVKWFPGFAQKNFDHLMEDAGDWAISRQRYWGIPLPIFEDDEGNYDVFGSKEELEDKCGVKLSDIHRDDLKNLSYVNEKSGLEMKAVPFIADVWFDSGCASFASHYDEGLNFNEIIEKYYPMNWVTEGQDQIRGWFSSLFTVGYVVTGKIPYNQVLFQQFVMAKDGTKMSKSLGNGIEGNVALEKYGADAIRYYLLSKAVPESKLNFNEGELKDVYSFFNTFSNITKFTNSYLSEYDLKDLSLNFTSLEVEDKWILYKLNKTISIFTHNMYNYKINIAYKAVEDFITKDLSKTYLKLVKSRTDSRDDNLLVILNKVLKSSLVMLSSAVPFKSEELYQSLFLFNKKESIFLENLVEIDEFIIKFVEERGIDENFELAQDVIASVLNAREKAKIGTRWPLPQIDIIGNDMSVKLEVFESLIKKLANILKINYDLDGVEMNYIIKPNFASLKQDFNSKMPIAMKAINMNKFEISNDLKNGVKFGIFDDLKIDYSKHIITQMEIVGEYVTSDFNGGKLILHTHQDEILLEEGYLRESIRRVQNLRKIGGFEKEDRINLSFAGSDDYFIDILNNWSSIISKKVGAIDLLKNELEIKDECEIKGKKLIVSISKN